MVHQHCQIDEVKGTYHSYAIPFASKGFAQKSVNVAQGGRSEDEFLRPRQIIIWAHARKPSYLWVWDHER